MTRPPEPHHSAVAWYRGWEAGYDPTAAFWGAEPWIAYKGGCDLDAPQATGRSWAHLLDEIDDNEDE